VHAVKVLAPALFDNLKQQEALELAHELLAELRLALVIERDRILGQAPLELGPVDLVRLEVIGRGADREDLFQAREQALEIPVLEVIPGGVLLDHALDDL